MPTFKMATEDFDAVKAGIWWYFGNAPSVSKIKTDAIYEWQCFSVRNDTALRNLEIKLSFEWNVWFFDTNKDILLTMLKAISIYEHFQYGLKFMRFEKSPTIKVGIFQYKDNSELSSIRQFIPRLGTMFCKSELLLVLRKYSGVPDTCSDYRFSNLPSVASYFLPVQSFVLKQE